MRQVSRFVSVFCLCFAMGCGDDSGGSKTSSAGKTGSTAATAGRAGSTKSCGSMDCVPGFSMLGAETGEPCCADATQSLCGTKDSAGECKAPKHDPRCPAFTGGAFGDFPGCCTENNMCGVDSMGLASWGCIPLSDPMLRRYQPNTPEPKACDAP